MARRRGFTLIELLVVVSGLALLISILLPSLQRARRQTKRTVCAAHLRQIGVGLLSYMGESNDRLPWASALPSLGPMPLKLDQPIYIADALLPYLSNEATVFRCPEDRPSSKRSAPNANKSYFQTERSSYQYRQFRPWGVLEEGLGGKTVTEVVNLVEERRGVVIADNSFWLMRDYGNFHQRGEDVANVEDIDQLPNPGKDELRRRYLYADGHVTDYEN